jgi:virulence-associated protein VapD
LAFLFGLSLNLALSETAAAVDWRFPHFRFGTDRKVRARALSQNNPKQFDDVKIYYALFQGTFDVAAKKWTVTDAPSINAEQYEALQTAYSDLEQDLEHSTFENEEGKAESLDQTMNSLYGTVQFILPPARLATVKREQIEWLKKHDAARSTEKKCKLMEARIRALQELVW